MNIRKMLKVNAWVFSIAGICSVAGYWTTKHDEDNAQQRKVFDQAAKQARSECEIAGGIQFRGYKGQDDKFICAKIDVISVSKD
jgi:hypothetical protein